MTWGIVVAMTLAGSGCSASPAGDGEDLPPVAEGSDDITAHAKLLGSYEDGRGRFASLALDQTTIGGKRKNLFVASEVVQCVRAPCPPLEVKGSWYARGTTLTLYPASGPSLTYKATLQGDRLTLVDARGTEIAQLTKKPPAVAGVAEALRKHGVEKLRASIDGKEVTAQGAAAGVTVTFADAVDKAIGLFLSDESGLAGYVAEMDPSWLDDVSCGSAPAGAKRVTCVANASASLSLLARRDTTPPHGETTTDAWIFVFSDGLSDDGYYAVVPKKGNEAPYIYNFN
jgi:hypothetical protein